jgi:hypothetical protein
VKSNKEYKQYRYNKKIDIIPLLDIEDRKRLLRSSRIRVRLRATKVNGRWRTLWKVINITLKKHIKEKYNL